MDLFTFDPRFGVLICRSCAYAVPPSYLVSHITKRHGHDACRADGLDPVHTRPRKSATKLAQRLKARYNILDPTAVTIPTPAPTDPPLPELELYRGYQCTRCPLTLSKTKKAQQCLQQHFNSHRLLPRKRGRPGKVADIPAEDEGPMFSEVFCQRFFVSGAQSSFFSVHLPSSVEKQATTRPERRNADLLRALVAEQLDVETREREAEEHTYSSQTSRTEVFPWLEMTRWPRYFNGFNMAEVAPLAYKANPITEPYLTALSESFDRIIEQAHQSIREDKVSVFDQAKISSFIPDRSTKQERMLMVKLQKSTFRAYKDLWKRLLCFVYRTSRPDHPSSLPHKFTRTQLFHLDRVVSLVEELLALGRAEKDSVSLVEKEKEVARDIDRACLLLCVNLLDHTLRGDHFESVLLSFLAVLGLDESPGGVFRSPLSYSPDLSKFIKMAQMLVVQRAVVAADQGEVEHPSDLLDEMRERFMVRGSRTPFDWACRLRSYAKKVASNTTSLGYIVWSENGEMLTYKETSFSMDALRNFVAIQARNAQNELEDLLLLHPDENRDDVVPNLSLHRLQDNHSNNRKGWNFLKDPRNEDQLQGSGDRWLLDRVLENGCLRDEMLSLTQECQVRWNKKAVQAYFAKLDQFLERLLLLIHITSGQPARSTELLSLQHSNTAQGHRRGIFMEDGLIGTVASYHKGYNITSSTKIIHRYLLCLKK